MKHFAQTSKQELEPVSWRMRCVGYAFKRTPARRTDKVQKRNPRKDDGKGDERNKHCNDVVKHRIRSEASYGRRLETGKSEVASIE